MNKEDSTVKRILLAGNYSTEKDLKSAEQYAVRNKTSIVDYLLIKGLITKDLLGQAFAENYKVSYSDLNSYLPTREQVQKIPEDIAKKLRVVLFQENKDRVVIATDDPSKKVLKENLKKLFPKKEIAITYSLSEDIDATFVHYRKPLKTRFTQIIQKKGQIAPEIITQIIDDSLIYHASDVHFEPQENEAVIRFRVDGVLQEAGRISKEYYENVLNRIKIQANLRIDDHFSAQDGAIRIQKDDNSIDIRVSIVPTLDGEKIVLRILSKYVKGFTLSDLGLLPADKETITQAAHKPFGMILVVGPTGSGKTTTLYSLLKTLNSPEVNVTTIEDPVEYKLAGTNQIQVNTKTGLTFAKGLRSIVRQDPDVILVGEIRDEETAEISVNAALTGHLLLSSFHANDASTAIPRLLDMAVEPFLLASTLELIIAQRLVRKICESCRVSIPTPTNKLPENVKSFFSGDAVTLYKGKGCTACNHTGYKGRTAIFEFIQISPELKNIVLQNPSSQQVWEVARKMGSESLFGDGLRKVKSGVTTLDELMRVAPPIRMKEK